MTMVEYTATHNNYGNGWINSYSHQIWQWLNIQLLTTTMDMVEYTATHYNYGYGWINSYSKQLWQVLN